MQGNPVWIPLSGAGMDMDGDGKLDAKELQQAHEQTFMAKLALRGRDGPR